MAKKRAVKREDKTADPTQRPRGLNAFKLTPREIQVAHPLSWGHTNAEIAEKLGCRPNTVKTHVLHLFMKFGVHDRRVLQRRIRMALSQDRNPDRQQPTDTP